MQFLMLYTPDSKQPACDQDMAQMQQFIERSRAAGELLATGGLFANPTRIRRNDGNYTVVDGPYAESKEVIAGFALMELASEVAALDAAHRFLAIAGNGVSEIHRIAGGN
ncbi:YciI family protein [Lysobacter sp. S4-A87]|uniref:YciI family protein n=1 Tax=Lysobacter sp. S4-A87 TaxID=2925843 RepID=UPI001F52C6DA|nr:YciI family protein [Lysobacter sp. S4-A87]UNK49272.1 YciI family protein [Lysobacter sp. S4-A87]